MVLGTKWLLSLNNVGSGFHCLRSFFLEKLIFLEKFPL